MSRALALGVYAALVVMAVSLHFAARRWPRRVPHWQRIIGTVTAKPAGRAIALLLWMWVGWHFFVR
jgi:hypothetical protein